jgi:hypothetical protein
MCGAGPWRPLTLSGASLGSAPGARSAHALRNTDPSLQLVPRDRMIADQLHGFRGFRITGQEGFHSQIKMPKQSRHLKSSVSVECRLLPS